MWIFGYASLIWKPEPGAVESRPGYIRGWQRRFAQSSWDHRGTPEDPGRVATLVPAEGEHVWGVAYRIEEGDAQALLERLDHREKAGYERQFVAVYDNPSDPVPKIDEALLYIGTAASAEFIPDEPLTQTAETIASSQGPSGSNAEYLLNLEEALRSAGQSDAHVFELAAHVRRLLRQ